MKFSEVVKEKRLEEGMTINFDSVVLEEMVDRFQKPFTRAVLKNSQTGDVYTTAGTVVVEQMRRLGASTESEITFDELIEAVVTRKNGKYFVLE